MPLAVTVGPLPEPAGLSRRALVTQARATRTGLTRRHQVVVERGCWEGPARWWLDHHGLPVVVPANDPMAVTGEARAHAAAGAGRTVGRRGHTMRHGQGTSAWPARQATAVVGLAGLTTADQSGTPEHGRHHHRRACAANPIQAVVVRHGQGRDYGPGGKPVVRTKASVPQPVPPFDDDDDRSLREHCGIKAAKQPWALGPPPQNTGRAVQVHVLFPFWLVALATASRLPCEPAQLRAAPVGWQRWRRPLLEQTRDKSLVFARHGDGIFPIAECALLVGVKRKDVPPSLGTLQDVLDKYRLTGHE
jgi:hypothetical protein